MWLLMHSYFLMMEQAHAQGVVPTADQLEQMESRRHNPDRMSSVVGNIGHINVKGVLTQEPDFFAELFGGGNTTYPEIAGALAQMDDDETVSEIHIHFDTPGGEVAGMFQAMDAIRDTRKPTTAVIGTFAASAGYGLASQANTIIASHRSSRVGSIGTAASFFVSENFVDVASSNAPNKRPDLMTDEGKKIIQDELDQMASLLDEAIATGRNTTVSNINANFGKGGMLLADAAISVGMVDSMASPTQSASSVSASGTDQEAPVMDLIQLKAEHPAVYAEAVAVGTTHEQKRVKAHISSGEACGDMTIATKAIADGVEYGDSEVAAAYVNAGMKRNQLDAAQDDDNDTGEAANGTVIPVVADTDTDPKAMAEEAVLAGVEAAFGSSTDKGEKSWLIQ